MKRRELWQWRVALASLLSIACGGVADHERTPADAAGGGGGAASDSSNGASASGGLSGNAEIYVPHRELCGLYATCKNGEITGEYENNCSQFAATCELGCRESRYSHTLLADEYGRDTQFAVQLAKAALCNQSNDGIAGDSAGGASGAAAFGEGDAAPAGAGGA
jgi:hypothetical protein